MTKTFVDALAKRHDADHNLNEILSSEDAEELWVALFEAVQAWEAAASPAEQDLKPPSAF